MERSSQASPAPFPSSALQEHFLEKHQRGAAFPPDAGAWYLTCPKEPRPQLGAQWGAVAGGVALVLVPRTRNRAVASSPDQVPGAVASPAKRNLIQKGYC